MFISELMVYTPSPLTARLPPLPRARRERGDVAQDVSERFGRGRPSNVLGEGGVLVHIFDGYEDPDQPWHICHDDCPHGTVDTLSASLISRRVPWLFLSSWGAAGLVIAPTTDVLCAFPADMGTGGHPNGRCPLRGSGAERGSELGGREVRVSGGSLLTALQQQYDGTHRKAHRDASGYNEIIINALQWEESLPHAIEAFVFASGGASVASAPQILALRDTHDRFLRQYGLSPEEVPLLEYVCSVQQLAPVQREGPCFVDVT